MHRSSDRTLGYIKPKASLSLLSPLKEAAQKARRRDGIPRQTTKDRTVSPHLSPLAPAAQGQDSSQLLFKLKF